MSNEFYSDENRLCFFEELLDECDLLFPFVAKNRVHWYPSGKQELTIKLKDGDKVIYDGYTNTLRRLEDLKSLDSEEAWRKTFGKNLENKMVERNMSQKDLSEKIGLSRGSISLYVNGKASPNAYILSRIAEALECSCNELIYTS